MIIITDAEAAQQQAQQEEQDQLERERIERRDNWIAFGLGVALYAWILKLLF